MVIDIVGGVIAVPGGIVEGAAGPAGIAHVLAVHKLSTDEGRPEVEHAGSTHDIGSYGDVVCTAGVCQRLYILN